MAWLRLFLVVCLMAVSFGAGLAGANYKYELKLTRITEEREAYLKLASSAVAMSDRSLTFAQGYQDVLDTCLERFYLRPTTEPVVATINHKKGGIGGPIDLRKQSRLP